MKALKRLYRSLSRHVTVLVIPHSDLPMLRGRFSLSFAGFLVVSWTVVTVWAGYVAGRHVDYWITKADNMVIRSKMHYLAEEVDQSRAMLEMARATDKQMRILLGMGSRERILQEEEALGGPSPADRRLLTRLLSDAVRVPQPAMRQSLQQVRVESERRLASFQEIAWYITNQRSLFRSTPNAWPTEGRITSGYGYRFSPFNERTGHHSGFFHEGIDLANSPDTPITATADGVVRYAGWSGGFGMMVTVDHGFGYSTLYGHTSKVTVKKGDHVRRGEMIAYMGTTGRSTGHHLHYEVWRHGKPVNPVKFLPKRGEGPSPDLISRR